MTAKAVTPFVMIENSVIDDYLPKIGPYGYTIYSVIKRHFNRKTGDCFPSYKTIARKSGIDRSTVIRYVKKLKAVNLIDPAWRFKEDGSHDSNQYNFQGTEHAVSAKNSGDCKGNQGSRSEPPPVVAEDTHPGSPPPPEQDEKKKKKILTRAEVDLLPKNHPTDKQKTCTHPPSEIVFLADTVTICHHCYGLLNENLRLQEEATPSVEIVAA